jgi:hypothetical protein
MDITPQDTTQQSISDDQELAKALAGVMPDAPEPDPTPDPAAPTPASDSPLQFEETPVTPTEAPAEPSLPQPSETPVAENDLESIKKDALGELRPLIGKVDLPAEEKFDTYLMLIRSTDDTSLIGPAHAAAQGIADEKRRAEALLEIIKEIDFFSHKDQPTS